MNTGRQITAVDSGGDGRHPPQRSRQSRSDHERDPHRSEERDSADDEQCLADFRASPVGAGERFGLMKFGSRLDVFLPPDAELRVTVCELVVAGETVLAAFRSDGAR